MEEFLPQQWTQVRLRKEAQPGSLPCPQSAPESSTQVFVQECAPGTQVFT